MFFSFLQDRPVDLPVPDDFGSNPSDGLLKVRFLQLALTNDNDIPTLCLQLAPDFLITFLVPCYLGRPELGIGLGNRIEFAVPVAVPEAAVDEDGGAILGKDDVRFSREFLVVYPIAKSLGPESVTQLQLRLCGGGVDGGHVSMALVRSENV